MTTLFYIIVALLFVYELFVLAGTKTIFESVKKHKEKINTKKQNGEKITMNDTSPTMLCYFVFNIFYLIFTIIGFMSSQWVLFAAIFFLSLIPKRYLWMKYADSIITLLILAFILINKFHLHINIL